MGVGLPVSGRLRARRTRPQADASERLLTGTLGFPEIVYTDSALVRTARNTLPLDCCDTDSFAQRHGVLDGQGCGAAVNFGQSVLERAALSRDNSLPLSARRGRT
jgi:hypothetical protein